MPGGRRNPLSMSYMLEHIGNSVQGANSGLHSRESSLTRKLNEMGHDIPFVDLEIQFIGAQGLPKMDVLGSADPYFVANLDNEITFVSAVKQKTLAPVWNEHWRVQNVPSTADLSIQVMDKDGGVVTDDFIGKFKTDVRPGAKEAEIEGPLLRRKAGTFWLKIDSKPSSSDPPPSSFPYLFAGPIRFSHHFSPTVGLFTRTQDDATSRLYSTWKIYLPGVPLFFGDVRQGWNKNYRAAQSIFQGPASIAVRSGIQAGHRMLYARSPGNGFGVIEDKKSVLKLLHGKNRRRDAASHEYDHRVKPAIYTYIISSEDFSFRFSETGAAFFVDFASKHALHSNCAENVVYSGEFHPRPVGGWAAFTDTTLDCDVDWEFVIDNNSGTYAPDKTMLPNLQRLLEHNFPGLKVYALDHGDPALKESVEACREYALQYWGVHSEVLEVHARAGEGTPSDQDSIYLPTLGKKAGGVKGGVDIHGQG